MTLFLITAVSGAPQHLDAQALTVSPSPRQLTILHFNDVYKIQPYKRSKDSDDPLVGGFARMAAMIDAHRDHNPLLTFGGDFMAPSLISTVTRGAQMVAAFNLLFSPLMDMAVLVLVGLTFAGQAMRMPASVDSLLRPQEGSLSELAEDEGSNYIAQVGSYIGVLGEVVMVIFTIECIAKILVLGFYRGADSYLKSGWNQLDFVVLINLYRMGAP